MVNLCKSCEDIKPGDSLHYGRITYQYFIIPEVLMTDESAKEELLKRAQAGLPKPQLDSADETERFLANRLKAFTTKEVRT
jgi:hypothetical protein